MNIQWWALAVVLGGELINRSASTEGEKEV